MVGRKPKPTELKEMAGNPGKRALNTAEPKPQVKALPVPTHIQGEARREWRRVAKLLAGLRVLTEADRTALELYVVTYARWREAEAQIQELGTIITQPSGRVAINPWVSVAGHAQKEMRALLAEFGMTPSSRTRVQALPEENEQSLAELLFAGVVVDG